jgi:hypothetical protein
MFEIIPTETMEQVAGGAPSGHTLTPPTAKSNDGILSSLNGIQSSLNDLSKNQNGGGFLSGTNGLMFMTMATVALSRRQQTTVVYGGRHGYYWQSSW